MRNEKLLYVSSGVTVVDAEIIAEAIEFLRSHVPPEGYFVGFSGGKDSIVILDLVRKSGVTHQAYYTWTTIDPPEILRFIRKYYPDVTILRPTLSFWAYIEQRGILPTRTRRWCCDKLKKDPSKHIPLLHRVFGIRREESARRATYTRIDNAPRRKKEKHYYPIIEWTEGDVWDYIEVNNLPYPSLYDEGFDRIGCIICPFVTGRKLLIHKARWPGMYRALDAILIARYPKSKTLLTLDEWMKYPDWPTKAERERARMQGRLWE